ADQAVAEKTADKTVSQIGEVVGALEKIVAGESIGTDERLVAVHKRGVGGQLAAGQKSGQVGHIHIGHSAAVAAEPAGECAAESSAENVPVVGQGHRVGV